MPKFKPYNQNQMFLLPPSLSDWLPSDHIARLVSDTVDELDLSAIEKTYSNNGAPAYCPRLMVKLFFFGHIKRVTSSRDIEKACVENIAFRYLSGNTQPDHGTLNLFRKNHLPGLKDLFSQIVMLCDRLNLIDPSEVSIDGTKAKACASKGNLYTQERIDKIREKIGKDLEEAIKLDEEEDKKFGDRRGYDQLPDSLSTPELRKKAIAEAKRKLEKLKQAEGRIKAKQEQCRDKEEKDLKKNSASNLTDPDANLMKMKDKSYQMGYNIQLSSSNQVITAYEVTDNAADTGQLKTMIEETESMTGQPVKKVKADAAYFTKAEILYLDNRSIDGYIPDPRKTEEEKQDKEGNIPEFDRRSFRYDQENDHFICPPGNILPFSNVDKKKGRKYVGESCADCPTKAKCTKGKHRYLFIDFELERLKKEMRAKLNTEEGKKIYASRMGEIEPVYGNLKQNQGFTQFRTRGKPMVLIETGLHSIAHNLVKMFNHLRGERRKQRIIELNALTRLGAVS